MFEIILHSVVLCVRLSLMIVTSENHTTHTHTGTHPKYLAGDISTDFIKDFYPEGYVPDELSQKQRRLIASSALSMYVDMNEADNHGGSFEDEFWNLGGDVSETYVVGVGSPDSQVLLQDKESITLERSHVRRFCFEDQDELTFEDQDWAGPHDALFKAALTDDDDDVVMEFVERLPQGVRVQVSGKISVYTTHHTNTHTTRTHIHRYGIRRLDTYTA